MSQGAMAVEPPQNGVVVVRDAETGKLRAPNAAEFKTLVPRKAPQIDAKTGQVVKAQVQSKANGARFMDVSDKAIFTVVQRQADGTLR
jgi:anti-sigma factor RsiW